MRIHKSMALISMLLLGALCALAADVNGKWTAQVPRRDGQTMDVTFQFKAEGQNLTGTVITQRGENPISDGKVNGDEISFTQTMQFQGTEVKLLYKGKVTGDEIKFTRQREGGDRTTEFTAKRAS